MLIYIYKAFATINILDTFLQRWINSVLFAPLSNEKENKKYKIYSFFIWMTSTKLKFLFQFFTYRCLGFIMAKLVLRELMDASVFSDFKSFLYKVYYIFISHCFVPKPLPLLTNRLCSSSSFFANI